MIWFDDDSASRPACHELHLNDMACTDSFVCFASVVKVPDYNTMLKTVDISGDSRTCLKEVHEQLVLLMEYGEWQGERVCLGRNYHLRVKHVCPEGSVSEALVCARIVCLSPESLQWYLGNGWGLLQRAPPPEIEGTFMHKLDRLLHLRDDD